MRSMSTSAVSCNPCSFWQNAANQSQWTLSLDSPQTHTNTGILVFVDRFSKMLHLVAVPESINASACARVFIDTIFRLHGLPRELVADRDPLRNSGDPCSKHSERAFRCRPLTTLKHMVRQNVQTAFLRKSFGVMSIRLRIGANSCQWWSPPLSPCVDEAHAVFVNDLCHPLLPTL